MRDLALSMLVCSSLYTTAWMMKVTIVETNRMLNFNGEIPLKTLAYNGIWFTLFFLNQGALIHHIKN